MGDLGRADELDAAFVVYLHLWRHTFGVGVQSATTSLRSIADSTGLSKRGIQARRRGARVRGVDINALIRFLVRDDTRQFRRAAEALAALADAGEQVRIDPIVLCELVWVLRAGYGRGRGEVADALDALLEAESLSIEDRELVHEAIQRFRAGKGDFADYLLGLRNRRAGCETTLTFDRKLRPADGFAAL